MTVQDGFEPNQTSEERAMTLDLLTARFEPPDRAKARLILSGLRPGAVRMLSVAFLSKVSHTLDDGEVWGDKFAEAGLFVRHSKSCTYWSGTQELEDFLVARHRGLPNILKEIEFLARECINENGKFSPKVQRAELIKTMMAILDLSKLR